MHFLWCEKFEESCEDLLILDDFDAVFDAFE